MEAGEARFRTEAIRGSVSQIREHLLAVYTRKGWHSLGYSSWGEYLSQEFQQSTSYLRRQTHAALLESALSDDDELVGTHREAHLRPLNEMLGDDDSAKALAYYLTLDRADEPTAQDFRRIAAEVYVQKNGDARIKERFNAGSLGVLDAYKLCKWAKQFEKSRDYDLLVVSRECSDADLIPIFIRLKKAGSETWDEIYLSGAMPALPEPIPLHKATTHSLLAWLDVASAEHRAVAMQPRWDERDKILEDILLGVRLLLNAPDPKSRLLAEASLRSAYERYESLR
jgi:hypothetical protein